MHALRIAHQGTELLEHGRITPPVAEPARSALRELRAGGVPLEEVLAASTTRRRRSSTRASARTFRSAPTSSGSTRSSWARTGGRETRASPPDGRDPTERRRRTRGG